jgi:hypothetical protein
MMGFCQSARAELVKFQESGFTFSAYASVKNSELYFAGKESEYFALHNANSRSKAREKNLAEIATHCPRFDVREPIGDLMPDCNSVPWSKNMVRVTCEVTTHFHCRH